MKRRHILGLLLSTLYQSATARTFLVKVAPGETSSSQSQILAAVSRRFPDSMLIQNNPARGSREEVILAIGPAGLQQALLAKTGERILSLFISGPTYQEQMSSLPPDVKSRVTAIFAEPPIAQQMALIDKLFGRQVVVGVLLGKSSAYLEPYLKQTAQATHLELVVAHLGDESVNRALLRLTTVDVLLALPDKDIYNTASLREVLETTYRRNMPLVGYSAGMVSAGALAATYASLEDILAHAAETVETISAGGPLPEPQFPRYWRTTTNEHVARSLNIVIDKAIKAWSNLPKEAG